MGRRVVVAPDTDTLIVSKLDELRLDVKQLDDKVDKFTLRMEHRVTKLEGRASLFGILGGAISGLLAYIGFGRG